MKFAFCLQDREKRLLKKYLNYTVFTELGLCGQGVSHVYLCLIYLFKILNLTVVQFLSQERT